RVQTIIADKDVIDGIQRRAVAAKPGGTLGNDRRIGLTVAGEIIVALVLIGDVAHRIIERDHGATAIIGKTVARSYGQAEAFTVSVITDPVLRGDGDALNVALEDEVHHARGRIRAIG